MPDFRKLVEGGRARLVYEVNVSTLRSWTLYDDEGNEFNDANLVSAEAIAPELPTEQASVATFRFHPTGDVRQCVLIGEKWVILNGGSASIILDQHTVVSVDRVGV